MPAHELDPYALAPPLLIAGRRLRPVAFGLALLCAVLAVGNVLGADELRDTVWAYLVAPLAAVDAVLFLTGWWVGSVRVAQLALAVCFGLHVARATFLLVLLGVGAGGVTDFWQGAAVAVIAGGSYLLETGPKK